MAKNAQRQMESTLHSVTKRGKLTPVVIVNCHTGKNTAQNYQMFMVPTELLNMDSYIATVTTPNELIGLIKAFEQGQENPNG